MLHQLGVYSVVNAYTRTQKRIRNQLRNQKGCFYSACAFASLSFRHSARASAHTRIFSAVSILCRMSHGSSLHRSLRNQGCIRSRRRRSSPLAVGWVSGGYTCTPVPPVMLYKHTHLIYDEESAASSMGFPMHKSWDGQCAANPWQTTKTQTWHPQWA